MARVHSLQHVDGLVGAAFAHDDAIGPHAQGVHHQLPYGHLAGAFGVGRPGFQAHHVGVLVELQFGGILDGDDALLVGDMAGKGVVPITDEIEMQEIEKACQTPFEGARAQLQKALGFLSDREHPDYKNCVKESISAVESVCETIVGSDNGATLGKAVKHLEEHGLKIHSSLREGISKLYGYACDQGGVRHGEGEVESTVTFEEAKLMMVTCSAIVNYLVSEYGKYGAENA